MKNVIHKKNIGSSEEESVVLRDYSFHVLNSKKGEGVKLHHHEDWDESWYILSGSFRITVEGEEIKAEKGDFVSVQRNKLHSIETLEDDSKRIAIFKENVEVIYED